MNVKELNKFQLQELKQHYYAFDKFEEEYELSYEEMATIDELVSDEEVFDFYADTIFCEDDFGYHVNPINNDDDYLNYFKDYVGNTLDCYEDDYIEENNWKLDKLTKDDLTIIARNIANSDELQRLVEEEIEWFLNQKFNS